MFKTTFIKRLINTKIIKNISFVDPFIISIGSKNYWYSATQLKSFEEKTVVGYGVDTRRSVSKLKSTMEAIERFAIPLGNIHGSSCYWLHNYAKIKAKYYLIKGYKI